MHSTSWTSPAQPSWGDDDDDDDFGDFGDADTFDATQTAPAPGASAVSPAAPAASAVRVLIDTDFESREQSELVSGAIADALFPEAFDNGWPEQMLVSRSRPSMLVSDRCQSIWAHLRTPPTAQTTEWTTSTSRRSFLISLGLPIDLDEILPAKNKVEPLVLSSRQRPGGDTPPSQPASATHSPSPSTASSKSSAAPPDFDADYARQLSKVSEVAVARMTYDEVQNHMRELERVKTEAAVMLGYWIDKRNSAASDKEKFEAVIESSIEYAQRLRKHTTRQAAIPRPRTSN
ncbi:uncharacterized protein V1510DRAFT_359765 [Dipodascopsis tothii]|uniref:uncharacterized protein n=1 Tax=Dipodascopsis tothii TaxID=44089 RepID=UPI0034CD5F96